MDRWGNFAYFDEDSGVGEVRFREDLLHDGLLDRRGVGHFGLRFARRTWWIGIGGGLVDLGLLGRFWRCEDLEVAKLLWLSVALGS